MKITFRYGGDITGITREAQFDLSALESAAPALAAALVPIAKAAREAAPTHSALSSALSAPAADQGLYEFDFSDRGHTHHIAYSRQSLPATLRAEIATLMQAARPVQPK